MKALAPESVEKAYAGVFRGQPGAAAALRSVGPA